MARKAVTIDLWHTLLFLSADEEERYMRGQASAAVESLVAAPAITGSSPLPGEELFRIYGRVLAGAVRSAEEGRTVTPADQFRAMAEAAGRRPDLEDYLGRLTELVRTTPFRRAPGALALLEGLRDRGYRLAVISNTVGEPGSALRPVLTRMGFDPWVERYTFSDERPWTKPSPEIFLDTLGPLGAEPGTSVHVGDGWSDIEGARRAGYRAAILYEGLHAYGPQYAALFRGPSDASLRAEFTVRALEEIPPIVDSVLASAERR